MMIQSCCDTVLATRLVAADLMTGGQRAVSSRYLTPAVLSLQLLVVYGVGETGELLLENKRIGDRFDQLFAVHLNASFKAAIEAQGYSLTLIDPNAKLWQLAKRR